MVLFGVPVDCINHAAVQYRVPAALIVSVIKAEGGRVGLASENKDGSKDYGVMQINSRWLWTLYKHGYTKEQVQYDPCINVEVGTWILAQRIADGKDLWRGVGDYHSYTLALNQNYSVKVKRSYETFASL